MSYIYSSDEDYYNMAGYYDAPSYTNSIYFVGTAEYAFGYLSSGTDVDVYSLGVLYAGYEYSLSASAKYWATNTYSGYANTPNITLLNSFGFEVGRSYSGAMSISNVSTDIYYVKVWDNSSSQYTISLDQYYVGFPNRSPTINNSTFAVEENSVATYALGAITAADPDGDSLSYSFTSGNTDVNGDGKADFKWE